MQKIIHLSLVVAVLLASMGFNVNIAHCSDKKESSINLFADPACCCSKTKNNTSKSCQDMACVVQRSLAAQTYINTSTEQEAKFAKEPVNNPGFSESIRPAILERTPHFTLPPPASGRFIGILHQTFII